MIDFTDFRKYKIAYLLVILSFAFLFAFRYTPFYYGAFIDVSVKPPESLGGTDFSGKSMEAWFNTQIALITSHPILKSVKSDISEEKLSKIVSAKRLGSSYVIRIFVSSQEYHDKLKSIVSDIASSYLSQKEPGKESIKENAGAPKAIQAYSKEMYDALGDGRMQKKREISAINTVLKNYESELKFLDETKPAQLIEIEGRMQDIKRTLVSLNSELDELKLVYADEWPAVVKLKNQIKSLENEMEKHKSELPAALALENQQKAKKAILVSKIDKCKNEAGILEDEFQSIEKRLNQIEQTEAVKRQEALKFKKEPPPADRIINLPVEIIFYEFRELRIRLLVAFVIGILFWVLLGRLLINAYLFWVYKDRFFKKR